MQIAVEQDHEVVIHSPHLQPASYLISLYEMLKFSAEQFFNIATKLRHIAQLFESFSDQSAQLSSDDRQAVIPELLAIDRSCEVVGLSYSQINIKRFLALLHANSDITFTYGSTNAFTDELSRRIQDELAARLFMQIRNDKVKYYLDPWDSFGQIIVEKFGSLSRDIEEAGKCLATERHPACIYHLMRIMEVGLRALGDSLALPNTTNRSWDAILKKANAELEKPHNDRSPEWQADEDFSPMLQLGFMP
jgi:hypothetical protein